MTITSITGATQLVFILAHPVDHVRAPRFYNPAFAEANLNWSLVPLGVRPEDFAATVGQLARLTNIQGLNLTIPHKAAAHALCSRIGPEAQLTGVVNTMRREADGTWAAESFDGVGFVEAARAHRMLHADKPAVIVGAGGAGTAIAFALAAAGVREVQVINREPQRAEQLVRALKGVFPQCTFGTDIEALRRAGLAVNATSLGLHAGDAMPFDPALLPADADVFDIIAARDTELMAASQARGLRTIGGRPMIEHQVAAQIAFWRGGGPAMESKA